MTSTSNLEMDHLEDGVASPDVVLNESLDLTDLAIAGMVTHNMASDADYTLSTSTDPEEWKYAVVKITDTGANLTTTRNIIVPTNTKQYLLVNATAQSLVLKTSGGSGITVATSNNQLLFCDGTNVIAMAAAV